VPTATVRFVRMAWAWFLVGLGLGSLLVLAKIGWAPPRLLGLRATHIHVMAVGWLVQWVFGIAFWIYPAWGSERTGTGATRLMACCWVCLNGGTAVRALGEACYDPAWWPDAGALGLALGGAAQIAAGVCFVVHIRGRIRGARWIRRQLEHAAAPPTDAPRP